MERQSLFFYGSSRMAFGSWLVLSAMVTWPSTNSVFESRNRATKKALTGTSDLLSTGFIRTAEPSNYNSRHSL
jgi:hypothetical protein